MEMIIEGQELQVFDLVACYAQRYQKTLIYFDLITYNALDATKKATVTAFYADFVDDYVMDIIKQGRFNTLQFDEENIASLMAGSWFPKEASVQTLIIYPCICRGCIWRYYLGQRLTPWWRDAMLVLN